MRKKTTSLFMILFGAASFAQIPTDNLLCHLKFSNNLNDETATANATIVGNAASVGYADDRFGNPNSALSIDNTTLGYVDLGDLALADPDYSISFWMNFNGFSVNQQKVISKRETCSTGSFFDVTLYSSPNTLVLESYALGDPAANINYNTALEDSTWIHITFVVNQTDEETKIYVDGALAETISWTTSLADGSMENLAGIAIGYSPCEVNLNVDPYDGLFDDLRIYTRALTATEVNDIYNEIENAGVSEQENLDEMAVYPNPANQNLNVRLKTAEAIEIINLSGTVILSLAAQNNHTLDISSLASGIYFVRNASGQTEKFIKL